MKKLILAALVLLSVESFAQTHVVQGSVFVFDSLKVANLEIVAAKSKSKVRSDSLGNYSIVCNDKDMLQFKSKLFGVKRIKIDKNVANPLDVHLKSLQTKEEVEMAIGYGHIREKDRTSAMRHLESKGRYGRFNSMVDVLKAHDPSLLFLNDNCVVIRGIGTVSQSASASCALILIDGVEVDNFSDLNPQLVDKVTILKDASSSAIYGVKGANGVILITTRK